MKQDAEKFWRQGIAKEFRSRVAYTRVCESCVQKGARVSRRNARSRGKERPCHAADIFREWILTRSRDGRERRRGGKKGGKNMRVAAGFSSSSSIARSWINYFSRHPEEACLSATYFAAEEGKEKSTAVPTISNDYVYIYICIYSMHRKRKRKKKHVNSCTEIESSALPRFPLISLSYFSLLKC